MDLRSALDTSFDSDDLFREGPRVVVIRSDPLWSEYSGLLSDQDGLSWSYNIGRQALSGMTFCHRCGSLMFSVIMFFAFFPYDGSDR